MLQAVLRRLRRRIRRISYYAAHRPRTLWSTATDVALLAALVLAPIAVWLASTAVTDRHVRQHVLGRLMIDQSGNFVAQVITKEQLGSAWLPDTSPVGEFELRVFVADRGWPLTTARTVLPPTIQIDRFAENKPAENVPYAENDPETRAIAMALRDGASLDPTLDDILRRWQQQEPEQSTHVFGWVLGVGLWWAMLWTAMLLAIGAARLGHFAVTAKKHVRGERFRSEGKCVHCGYDLRGLEFNERCPECGHLAW